jgi:quinol monooxygenase YgiN
MVDVPTSISAQGTPRQDVVTVVEKWESIEALEAHLMAVHMLEYRERVKALVVSASLQILEPA